MIVKMIKYDFVLYAGERDSFLSRLQQLGLVDVTVTGWEPSDADMKLIADVESKNKAVATLRALAEDKEYVKGEPFTSGDEAYAAYAEASASAAALRAEIARLGKSAEELKPWGEFSTQRVTRLAADGIVLRYFTCYANVFEASVEEWSSRYTVELISKTGGVAYFVVVASAGEEIQIDAEELKAPAMNYLEAEKQVAELESQLAATDRTIARCAASVDIIETAAAEARERLQLAKVVASGEKAADGALVVMEGWAEAETAARVDAMLEQSPNTIYLKRDPEPEDDTPVKLKNNRFARLFELIGGMYALPKYGTVDLTPFFAPFYMLFFAICLCDIGYGTIIAVLGAILIAKGGNMKQAGWLSLTCGVAAMAFGFYANSCFGMSISDWKPFEGVKFLDFQHDFFYIALVIGIVQVLFGMLINICMTVRLFGPRKAMGLLGWFLLLLSSCLAMVGIPHFTLSSVPYMIVAAVSVALMLLFNDRNPLASVGTGLWNTYNNVTGLLSDVLSYIRLFAIGLSGGVLAQVFNSLALGLTGLSEGIAGSPVGVVILQIVAASIILLIGHGINLFMSVISSFVHPMRLTFVEFYKNAGFEMTVRTFDPLKKESK